MVIESATNRTVAVVLLSVTAVLAPSARGEPSLRLIGNGVEIVPPGGPTLPGEPVAALLDLTVEVDSTDAVGSAESARSSERRIGEQTARMVSQGVVIDGVTYRNRLSQGALNDGCQFSVLKVTPFESSSDRTAAFKVRCLATLFVNARDIKPVFDSPGQHEVSWLRPDGSPMLGAGFVVRAPSGEEVGAFERLKEPEMLFFLMDPEDCSHATPGAISLLSDAYTRYSRTDYGLIFGTGLGLARYCELHRHHLETVERLAIEGRDTSSAKESFEKDVLSLEQYFRPVAGRRIASELVAAAYWHLAELELLKAKRASSIEEAEQNLSRYKEMCQRIEESPYSGRYVEQVSRGREGALRHVEAELHRKFLNEPQ